jgi:hypothetical protein
MEESAFSLKCSNKLGKVRHHRNYFSGVGWRMTSTRARLPPICGRRNRERRKEGVWARWAAAQGLSMSADYSHCLIVTKIAWVYFDACEEILLASQGGERAGRLQKWVAALGMNRWQRLRLG